MKRSPKQIEEAVEARKELLEQLHAQLEEGVAALQDEDRWKEFLAFTATFHRYSFNNVMLLLAQKPDAGVVASFNAWKDRGHLVRKGEKSLRVLAPMTYRRDKLDPAGKPVTDDVGKPVKETVVKGFKPVPVFDGSQVDPPVTSPHQPQLLPGEAPAGLWDALQGIAEDAGFRVERGHCGTANGFTSHNDKLIRVRDDVDDAQAVKTLAHEVAHMILHAPDGGDNLDCRGVIEVEAESVAYIVAAAHGMDTTSYTFPYVAGWVTNAARGTDMKVEDIIRATGQKVVACADKILSVTQPPATVQETEALAAEVAKVDADLAAAEQARLDLHPLAVAPDAAPVLVPVQHALF